MEPKRVRVVVVSPNDVEDDVLSLQAIILRLKRNLYLAGRNIVPDLGRWKTDVYAGVHPKGPQAHIDSILEPDKADILIGVLWKWFGVPGPDGQTPTEHEIRLAYEATTKGGKPHIILCFRREKYDPASKVEADQWTKVIEFREEFFSKAVCLEYAPSSFESQIYDALWGYMVTTYPAQPQPEILLTSVPEVVRAEGITETIGEILLHFQGYSPGMYDIRLFLNTSLTNRLTSTGMTDASLSVDGNPLIYGEHIGSNAILFRNVAIGSPQMYGRITKVRANANALGVTRPRYPVPTVPVIAALSIQPTGSAAPPEAIGQTIVGFVKPGFTFHVMSTDYRPLPLQFSRVRGVNPPLIGGLKTDAEAAKFNLYLRFSELLPRAFRTAAEEGGDFGTRFQVCFFEPYVGAQIFVTTREMFSPLSSNPKAVLISTPVDSTATPVQTKLVEGIPVAQLPMQNYMGVDDLAIAVWEWVSNDPLSSSSLEDIFFGLAMAREPGQITLGTLLVSGCLGPVSTQTSASPTEPIPRFADTSKSVEAIFIGR